LFFEEQSDGRKPDPKRSAGLLVGDQQGVGWFGGTPKSSPTFQQTPLCSKRFTAINSA